MPYQNHANVLWFVWITAIQYLCSMDTFLSLLTSQKPAKPSSHSPLLFASARLPTLSSTFDLKPLRHLDLSSPWLESDTPSQILIYISLYVFHCFNMFHVIYVGTLWVATGCAGSCSSCREASSKAQATATFGVPKRLCEFVNVRISDHLSMLLIFSWILN